MARREKKPVHHVQMTDGNGASSGHLLQNSYHSHFTYQVYHRFYRMEESPAKDF